MSRMGWVCLTGLVLALSGAAGAQQAGGNALVSAGFVMRPADTPEKLTTLKSLPANKFVHRKAKDGSVYYPYADHGGCVCAYVGRQQAMDSYRWNRSGAMTDEQLGRWTDPAP